MRWPLQPPRPTLALLVLATGCEQELVRAGWPDTELYAGFLMEVGSTGQVEVVSTYPDRGSGDDGPPRYRLGDGQRFELLGIDEAALRDLTKVNLGYERLRSRTGRIDLVPASCDAGPDRLPVPSAARLWRFDLESRSFLPTAERASIAGQQLSLSPQLDCPEHPERLVAFDPDNSHFLPSGTPVGGVEWDRNRGEGSSYLHLYAVKRIDDDLVVASANYALFVFRRGRKYSDQDSHRSLLPARSEFVGELHRTGPDRILAVRDAGNVAPPAVLEYVVSATELRLVRTTTIPLPRVMDFAFDGRRLVAVGRPRELDGEEAIGSWKIVSMDLQTGEVSWPPVPPASTLDRVKLTRRGAGVYAFGDSEGALHIGPLDALVRHDLVAGGSVLRVVEGLETDELGNLWVGGEQAAADSLQPEILRVAADGTIGRWAYPVPATCGRPDECGSPRAFFGRKLAWWDSAKRELLHMSGTCRGIIIMEPARGCSSILNSVTATELKSLDVDLGWVTAVGKEGLVLELDHRGL
ncbi:MAG: hypothetical protein HYV07_08135 [Deltaproteobacteria bacterium]|nr:hypothetical protein [Deltaproteobacteria bacterium]